MSKIPSELIHSYYNRFVNRADVYNRAWCDQEKYGYEAVYEPVTLNLIAHHIAGQTTLGFPALSKDATCKWCCWDSDAQNGKLERLQEVLLHHSWKSIREGRREGRDGHLWMFFDDPVPAVDLIRLATVFQNSAGIEKGEIEFFPKQAKSMRVGSAVRGPLGIHLKPEAQRVRGWFNDAPKDALAQLNWLATQQLNRAAAVIQCAEELRTRELANRRLPTSAKRSDQGPARLNDVLALCSDVRRIGKEFVAQCPLCAGDGHDKHRDNLRISLDGKRFCCVFGGPARVHTAPDIIGALQQLKSPQQQRHTN